MYKYSEAMVRCVLGEIDGFEVGGEIHERSALSPFFFAVVMNLSTAEVRHEFSWTMMLQKT